MERDARKKEQKRKYEKPRLRVTELAAEEVLAVGCKTTTPSSAFGGGPTCMIRNCSGRGS